MTDIHTEETFEAAIESHLLEHGGYVKANPDNISRELALDGNTVVQFLKTSQKKEWQKISSLEQR
jgi:type I restriction enzyme, R subunit